MDSLGLTAVSKGAALLREMEFMCRVRPKFLFPPDLNMKDANSPTGRKTDMNSPTESNTTSIIPNESSITASMPNEPNTAPTATTGTEKPEL
jgi:hypothetical protein